MRALLQAVGDHLRSFVGQRDAVGLLIASPATDALPILTVIEGLEAQAGTDLFWICSDAFEEPATYAKAVVEGFKARHRLIQIALQNEGMDPWPPIPGHILGDEMSPADRIRELAAFSRDLLPGTKTDNSIWVFYPLTIADPASFNRLMRQVLQHEFPDPWCHHLRFMIRNDPADPMSVLLTEAPRIKSYTPDLSPEAVRQSLASSIEDESLPLEQRLANLMVSAGADQAMHRYAEAFEQYALLHEYHAATNDHTMAAVALNGMGEVCEKLGDPERAGELFEQALILAGDNPHPPAPLLLNVIMNLAHIRMTEQTWASAAAYYDLAQQLATVARNAPVRIQALEYLGICQQRLQQFEDAEHSWIAGSAIAAALQEVALCRGLILQLCRHYRATGQLALEQERRTQLEALGYEGSI